MLKMKNYEELSENSYRLTVCYGYEKGKQIRKRKTFKFSKTNLTDKQKEKEVLANYHDFKREVENGLHLDSDKITFSDFTKTWLSVYAEKELAPMTLNRYKQLLERINQELGSIKLCQLQKMHIQKFMNTISEDGARTDHKYILKDEYMSYIKENKKVLYEVVNERTVAKLLKGNATNARVAYKMSEKLGKNISVLFITQNDKNKLSQQTLLHHLRLINTILNNAVEEELLSRNPAAKVKPPRVAQKEMDILTGDEIDTILELIKNEQLKYQVAVYIGVLGGLRLGEIIALKWSDIDFDAGEISITKSGQYVSGIGNFEKTPKNDSSNRIVTIPEVVLQKLRELQIEQNNTKKDLGNQWIDQGNIFTQWNGKRISHNTISHWFTNWIATTDLPKVTFHGLRHSHASFLIAEGWDVVSVADRLGHSKATTTLSFYAHPDNKKSKDIAKALNSRFA